MTKNKLIIILSVLVACLFVALLYLLSSNNQKITSIPTPTPTTIIEWGIYENKEYGFSFEYPKTEKVSMVGAPVLLALNVADITISVLQNQNHLSFDSWLLKNKDIYFEGSNLTSTIKKSGMSILESNVSFGGVLVKNDFVYIINSPKNSPYFNKIISTFKIVDSEFLLEDWSTYKKVNNFLSWDNCGADDNEVSQNIKQKFSALAQVSRKEINRLTIINTPTLGFSQADIEQFVLCQAGSDRPLVVLPDRILWIGSCGTGVLEDGVELCEQTRTEIEKIYE